MCRSISRLHVWISGAGSGIGLSLAEYLAAHGCGGIAIVDVLSESRGEIVLSRLAKLSEDNDSSTKFVYHSLDIRDKISVKKSLQDAHEKLGGLDTIINNAGVAEEEDIYRAMGVNVIGQVFVTELALNLFSHSPDAQNFPRMILNMSSAAGLYPLPMHEYYTASKHALVGYSRSVASRALKQNTHVVCVCPTWVSSGMGALADMHGVAAESGIDIMRVEELIQTLVRVLEGTTLAGQVIYVSPKTGARLASTSLQKSLDWTSKL